jgi:tetratricopeptide (TPR) repeat protein
MRGVTAISLFFFIVPFALFANDTHQTTQGGCSPAINNANNVNININCPGVPSRATHRLNIYLRKIKGLEAKLAEANRYKDRYQELQIRLAAEGENRILAEQARKLLVKGDIDAAARLLDRVIQQQSKEISVIAENFFTRGQIALLQFQPDKALVFLDQAYNLKPENPQYAHEYALALYHKMRWDDAEHILIVEIETLRHQEATEDRSTFLAKALNNLGGIRAETFRFQAAEANFNEAEKIYRQLILVDRPKFLSPLATTLSNKAAM